MDLLQLSKIAIKAARAAGAIIQQHMHEDILVETKDGGSNYASQVVTKVDKASEKVILEHLLPSCQTFNLALLTEESPDDGSRFKRDYFWCVDPMDGTLAFINKHPGFSVSIALVSKEGTPQIGIVFDPSTDTLYHAIKGHGAFKDGEPWQIKNNRTYLSYLTDSKLKDSHRADEISDIINQHAKRLGFDEIKEFSGAGAVLNAMLVLEYGPACMLKFPKKAEGGGSIWDYAATACIYQELGLPATDFSGGKLELNKKDGTFMNHAGVYFSNL